MESVKCPDETFSLLIDIPFLFEGQSYFVTFLEPHRRPFYLLEEIVLGTDHLDALKILD